MALLALVVVVVGVIRLGTHASSHSTKNNGGAVTPILGASSTPSAPQLTATPAGSPSVVPTVSTSASASATASAKVHRHTASSSPTASSSASHTSSTASPTPTSHATHTSSSGGGTSIVTPAYGSYPYATSGGEKLAGSSRSYPSKSTITLAKASGGCTSSTWQPISQHKEVEVICPDGSQAVQLKSEQQTIGFAGFDTTQTLNCTNAVVYATTLKAGETWSFTCSGSGTTAKQEAKAIGLQTFTIGGKSVKAFHVHITTTISGSDSGTSTEDYWYAPSLGNVVKQSMVINAKQGSISYQGHYTRTLTSTKPS